jgi:hypothetical protein
MSFTYDTKSSGSGSGDPVTVAHTCSADTDLLVVWVFGDGASRTGGVPSYNSVSMTDSGEGVQDAVNKAYGEIFYLISPSTGDSYNVSVPNTGSASLYIHVVSFEATGTVSKHSNNYDYGSTANPSINVSTTADNGLMVGALMHDANSPNNTPGTNYTEAYLTDWGPEYVASEYDLDYGSSGSIAVDWSESTADDWAIIGLAFEETSSGVTVTPAAVSAVGAVVAPTVVYGSVSITPTPASAVSAVVAPTVVKGSVSVTPTAASAISAGVDPSVLIGDVTVTPTPASATGATVNPTVVLGSTSVTPTPASAIGAVVAPTVVYGSVSITPTPASAVGAVVAPTVQEGGDVIYTPAEASAVGTVVATGVVQSSMTVTPTPASAVGAVVAPSVVQGSISITPAPASSVGAIVAPTVVLGSTTSTPAAATAIGAVYGPIVDAGQATGDYVNIYSAALNSGFDGTAGSINLWAKVSASGDWTDGTARYMVKISVDANNQVYIRKSSTSNQIEFGYIAGGTSKTVAKTSVSTTGWFVVGITWDKAADQVKAYFDGVQVGATQTSLGTWSGSLSSSGCAVGASDSSGSDPWQGYIGHVAVWDLALSEMQSLWMATE